MKDMSTLWTEEEARRFLGKKIKDLDPRYPLDDNGVPIMLPDQIRFMKLDSPKVREALQTCANATAGDIILIIGPGGSGKSVIYRAVAHSVEKALCLAPTGVAAMNLQAGGWMSTREAGYYGTPTPTTINSGLHIAPAPYLRVEDADAAADTIAGCGWSHILVDEISMVSPNVLDVLIHVADLIQVPLILFGDPMQLPPVERNLAGTPAMTYPSWRFFSAYGWMLHDEDRMHVIVLDSIYRQDDPGFKSMLNRARVGELTREDEMVLRRRACEKPDDDALVLCFRNETAQTINAGQTGKHKPVLHCSSVFRKLLGDTPLGTCGTVVWDERGHDTAGTDGTVFLIPREGEAPDRFTWDDEMLDGRKARELETSATVQKSLVLYPGDRIMITKNMNVPCADGESDNLYAFLMGKKEYTFPISRDGTHVSVVNGSMGTYLGRCNALASRESWWQHVPSGRWDEWKGFSEAEEMVHEEPVDGGHLVVRLDSGETVFIPAVRFTATATDRRGDSYETEAVLQYPVRLAFAITYHKSQGLTLDKVHMMLDPRDPMPPGLGYLGISRCRSLEGLTLNMYTPGAFDCDALSKNFLEILDKMAGQESESGNPKPPRF